MVAGGRGAPRIAVLLDENTSGGGTRYEAAKGTFDGVAAAGGLPFGIPYRREVLATVLEIFYGLLTSGGRFAYPEAWYLPGQASRSPASQRLAIEQALVAGFLARRKPVFGLCAGMQLLACLHGCRLTPDLRTTVPAALDHDGAGVSHPIALAAGSRLAAIIGQPTLTVNSHHREAVAEVSEAILASAHAPDGIVEAVEVPGHRFAIGIQWHQELFAAQDHPGNRLFGAFVDAARERPDLS